MLLYVLVTVISVLALTQNLTVQQMLFSALATVIFVLVLVQYLTVRKVMLSAQVLLVHVTVQAVAQCLIVSHVLTLMVYADIQHVVVIFAAMRMIMVLPAPPVILVAVALVLRMSQLDPLA